MKYFLSLAVLISMCVGLFSASPVFAQKMLEDFMKPMPELPVIPEEEFKKRSTLYKEEPFGDPSLAYSVRLPKKWTKQSNQALAGFAVSNRVLGEVDRFFGPVRIGERSYFSIRAMALDYKLTAEQWLILHLLENGYTIEGIKTIDDSRVEVIYVLIDRNTTYFVSAVAQVSGDRVVLAQYVVPSDAWEEEAGASQRVIESYSLDTIGDGFVEAMTPYRFLDIAEMQYPNSWELKAKPLRSVDRMSISLLNVEAKNQYSSKRILKGKIDTYLASEYVVEDIEDEITDFINKAGEGKLQIQDEIEEYNDFTVNEEMDVIEIKSYRALDKDQTVKAYEYWLAVLRSGEYYYFVTLLTPSRDVDYFSWARNTQTFRVVVENVEPLI